MVLLSAKYQYRQIRTLSHCTKSQLLIGQLTIVVGLTFCHCPSLAQLAELIKYADQMLSLCVCVCLDVNYSGINCKLCTQRLVILHALTY